MEEILASIRRIIADDVAGEHEARASLVQDGAAQPESDGAAPTAQLGVQPEGEPDIEAGPQDAADLDPVLATSTEAAGSDPFAYEPDENGSSEASASDSRDSESRAPEFQEIESRPAASHRPQPASREPIAMRARPLPAALRPAPRPNSRSSDMASDESVAFAAALMDLSIVEQAVNSELSGLHQAVSTVASVRPRPATAPKASPETADMQVQAKSPAVSSSAGVSSRSASAPTADRREEVRFEDARAEMPRGFESRGFEPRPVLARAPFGEAERPNRLLSGSTGDQVAASFGTLTRTVASNTRSMEDVVTDVLRPMLKSWLDDNLPELVERLVRAEIERVARQGE